DDITSLRVAHDEDSILRKVISEGTHFIGDLKESGFDESLFQTIGAPQYPTGVLLPLKAGGKTIALIYGDFGEQHPNLSFVDALEVLAAYSTMAFDLALARWH
ncbi:hypothetical protein KAI87_16755, partial [Myxococcota bacterium]|nr:hypothetical protein [Myxococcota bacterium]